MNNENHNTEYKRIWKDEYLKWVCGFANAQGGKIYIGIDDDMSDVGVTHLHQLLEDIPNKIVTMLGIVPSISHIERDGKDIIEIDIEQSNIPISFIKELSICGAAADQSRAARTGFTTISNEKIRQKLGRYALLWRDD